MAKHPRIITEDAHFQWDGGPARLAKGTYIDVPPGSALESAIGTHRLAELNGKPLAAPEQDAEPDETAAPAPKKRAAAAADADGKDA